jgi:hypothetical protein
MVTLQSKVTRSRSPQERRVGAIVARGWSWPWCSRTRARHLQSHHVLVASSPQPAVVLHDRSPSPPVAMVLVAARPKTPDLGERMGRYGSSATGSSPSGRMRIGERVRNGT